MIPWTVKQEECMRTHCFRGVEAVQRALARECGVKRTLHAIEAHASRIHCSLRVRHQCPECGCVGVRLNRQSGMCTRCTEFYHVAEEEAFNELLELEAAGCNEGTEIDAARAKYAALRQANSRLCRRHGLLQKSKRSL